MRGTRTPASRESVQNGIIPAYAGNTSLSGNLEDFGGDHPRVCGEHLATTGVQGLQTGSSPRMRGTRRRSGRDCRRCRIIPAYAGNTLGRLSFLLASRDHPRVCGEHLTTAYEFTIARGSSPRMRGTRTYAAPLSDSTGIIPAYAGNTISSKHEKGRW